MLLRLSRLSLWLAAAAAAVALFGPAERRGSFTDVALALAAVAFVLWRGALALHRRLEQAGDAIPDAVPLDSTSLHEVEGWIASAAAEAAALEPALHRVGELLRGELGARTVRAFLVSELDGVAGLSELVAAHPGFQAPRRIVALDGSAIGMALRERRACIDLPRAVALPVMRAGSAVALIELTGIHMTVDEGALGQLLAAAGQSLAALVERSGSVRHDFAAVSFQSGGCAC